MKANSTATIHCPLCGFEFEKRDSPCARGCPMGKYCNLICCPNCRYEFPAEPAAPSWLKRLFRRRPTVPAPCEVINLSQLPDGAQGELVSFNNPHTTRCHALAVFGLVPGSRLILQQKRPAYVIRVGETELALDPDIAREILVRRVTSTG